MPPRPVRRFSIADGTILIAAAAVACLLLRAYMPGFLKELVIYGSSIPDRWGLWRLLGWVSGPGSCMVVPGMAALIAIRLRRPRPRRFRIASQPGFVACVAVMASLAPGLLWYASIRHRPVFQRPDWFNQAWSNTTYWTGTAVVGAWLALALAGRFRPEPSWVDRAGRVLGAYWMALIAALMAIHWSDRIFDLLARWEKS